jgi:hypothetical protein
MASPKTQADALRILQSRTLIREGLPLVRWPRDKDFIGTFTGDGFRLIPARGERSSFRPEILGRVTDTRDGCAVAVRMAPLLSVSVFMIVWLSLCALLLCIAAGSVIAGRSPLSFGVLVPLLMIAFGFVLLHAGFRYSAERARRKLIALLKSMEIYSHR